MCVFNSLHHVNVFNLSTFKNIYSSTLPISIVRNNLFTRTICILKYWEIHFPMKENQVVIKNPCDYYACNSALDFFPGKDATHATCLIISIYMCVCAYEVIWLYHYDMTKLYEGSQTIIFSKWWMTLYAYCSLCLNMTVDVTMRKLSVSQTNRFRFPEFPRRHPLIL